MTNHLETLRTVGAVVDALGEGQAKRAAALLRVSEQAVSKWKVIGRLPPQRHKQIVAELKKRGFAAHRSLWPDWLPNAGTAA